MLDRRQPTTRTASRQRTTRLRASSLPTASRLTTVHTASPAPDTRGRTSRLPPSQPGQPGTHQAGYGQPGPGAGAPGAPYGYDPVSGLPYSEKSKLVAGLLGILLGGFGVGRFYTGHIGLGVAQLMVTLGQQLGAEKVRAANTGFAARTFCVCGAVLGADRGAQERAHEVGVLAWDGDPVKKSSERSANPYRVEPRA